MGERIQQLRKNLGITQADLAKKIAISHAQMARYEIKNIYPPADVLKHLADVLNTSSGEKFFLYYFLRALKTARGVNKSFTESLAE